ncbi:hypothetical protein [Sphingobium chungbukense]|uniref:hypothetical protein n=1 Tax=Sphingobium chungbukense TaxID=56193 RepID=UPI000AD402A5|nr:hypothetical protein [Sphingobium chungbukense]
MSRYRYRWKDRHDDLVNRNRGNPWPLRIEFALLACLSLAAIATGIVSAGHWIAGLLP